MAVKETKDSGSESAQRWEAAANSYSRWKEFDGDVLTTTPRLATGAQRQMPKRGWW